MWLMLMCPETEGSPQREHVCIGEEREDQEESMCALEKRGEDQEENMCALEMRGKSRRKEMAFFFFRHRENPGPRLYIFSSLKQV